MAVVQLNRQEMETGLPAVCLRCGAPATVWHQKTYELPGEEPEVDSGLASRARYLVHLGKSFFRPKLTLNAPFCATHQHHWYWRKLVIAGGLCLAVVVLLGGIVLSKIFDWNMATVFFSGMGVLVCWCLVAVIAHETSIHHTAISEDGITLSGVSDRFAANLRSHRS